MRMKQLLKFQLKSLLQIDLKKIKPRFLKIKELQMNYYERKLHDSKQNLLICSENNCDIRIWIIRGKFSIKMSLIWFYHQHSFLFSHQHSFLC